MNAQLPERVRLGLGDRAARRRVAQRVPSRLLARDARIRDRDDLRRLRRQRRRLHHETGREGALLLGAVLAPLELQHLALDDVVVRRVRAAAHRGVEPRTGDRRLMRTAPTRRHDPVHALGGGGRDESQARE